MCVAVQSDGGSNTVAPFIMSSSLTGNIKIPVNIESSYPGANPNSSCKPSASSGVSGSKQHKMLFDICSSGGSNVIAPVILSSNLDGEFTMPINIKTLSAPVDCDSSAPQAIKSFLTFEEANKLVPDKAEFLKEKRVTLVERARNVEAIIDCIFKTCLTSENVNVIKAKNTSQEKMRELLSFLTTERASIEFFSALWHVEKLLLQELLQEEA
ncbi:uncharacterized protein LOC102365530 [Latimeria chalumnae]|uniref:uncharacterized protein LOC102365530 n=1 Tax=Latimeria chalumnae TaxID=7897 RepID=UPI0003C19814|nr:PREDICTED: uncharacterized protein LOC102365530 [Latimeria chalumnae]XP_014351846.1 PREDICTED: uncharacterized protein LOC102365530 [Latimeria chalumnae]|eukprot:XP_006008942.1 PREDICTED: uncharacterized protein LOC102365530 [Latimeria chalumnae]